MEGYLPGDGVPGLAGRRVIALESVVAFLTPGPLDGIEGARNPFGLEGYPWLDVLGWTVLSLLPICMLASAASLVLGSGVPGARFASRSSG